ncbi:type II secretion system protein [Microbacterium hibisci]|uniref:type II secretion system protein n=1 Tax=Microbacterium hibisci TaxID=2036000 RepID=UPI001EF18C5F|nr:prepilin-type N-terminal cleavage/methylation domain-containing protein [Microbacterium hibisci]
MRGRGIDTAGFSLVEVIIAMFLLGIIAVALLPALWQGTQLSAQQSAVATATRQLNSLVEDARQSPTCSSVANAVAPKTGFSDGSGRAFSTEGVVNGSCAAGSAVSVSLTATQGTSTLASVDAIIYVPAMP